MAKQFLDKKGLAYEVVYADVNPEIAREYDVKQAPTLVVISDGEIQKYQNASNIRAFVETVSVNA